MIGRLEQRSEKENAKERELYIIMSDVDILITLSSDMAKLGTSFIDLTFSSS